MSRSKFYDSLQSSVGGNFLMKCWLSSTLNYHVNLANWMKREVFPIDNDIESATLTESLL